MNYKLIKFIEMNGGKPTNMSWYEIGKRFNLEPSDLDRARNDKEYEESSIAKKANDMWRYYIKNKENLELTKETYRDGKLSTEVFRKKNEPHKDFSQEFLDNYDIDGITTNPNGGAWIKYKKKVDVFEEDNLDNLRKIVKQEVKPEKYNFCHNLGDKKACMVYTSDKHIGALTKGESIYKNPYGPEEIEKRVVDFTLMQIDKLVNLHGKFEKLYLMDLGDGVDGWNAKTTRSQHGTPSHHLPQQMNNREQFNCYLDVHVKLFDAIVEKQYAKDIIFIGCANSNHGGDFDYIVMRTLEVFLNQKYPFIKTHVTYNPINHFFYGPHAIVFGHGKDDSDMKHGLPLHVDDRTEVWIDHYMDKNNLKDHRVTVVSGDKHRNVEEDAKRFRYRKVMSQYGSSKWIHNNFGPTAPGLSIDVMYRQGADIFPFNKQIEIPNISNTGLNV